MSAYLSASRLAYESACASASVSGLVAWLVVLLLREWRGLDVGYLCMYWYVLGSFSFLVGLEPNVSGYCGHMRSGAIDNGT